jgi:alkane 1-monooxygenase
MASNRIDHSNQLSTGQADNVTFKVWRFAIVFGLVLFPAECAYGVLQGYSWLAALPLLTVHLLIPVMDALIKAEPSAPFTRDQASGRFVATWAFDWPLLCLPGWFICLTSTLWLAQDLSGWTWWLIMIGMGSAGGILAINPAHELIHRRNPVHRWAGGFMLSAVCYGAFKIEHVRGHHRWVGTDRDKASAKRGQTVYSFVPISILATLKAGFVLEQERLSRQKLAWYHNENLRWTLFSLAIAAALYLLAGWQAVGGFFVASIGAIIQLELINYIEHYGLRRRQLPSGEPEPVTEVHSWNCNTWLVNAYLFNLQKHADHHAHPGREYLSLRDMPNAPQLPLGYGSMMLVCLLPQLWFKMMHPRLDALAQSTSAAQQTA